MRIFLDIGHTAPPDTGAFGYIREEFVINAVGPALVSELTALGHIVGTSKVIGPASVRNSLEQRVAQSAAFKPDLFISLHANANVKTERPMGTEVYANNTSDPAAINIEKAIASLGFKSRGVKSGNFFVIKNNSAPRRLLVELFFVDSKADVDLYNKVGPQVLAKKIADAITQEGATGTATASNRASTEPEQFLCNIKRYCAKNGYDPVAFLAVRLFETGGSLAAGYQAEFPRGREYPAFGILQWTPAGCEPLQERLGVGKAHTRENNIAAYKKVLGLNRLKQLELCFAYYDFWEPLLKKNFPQFKKDSIEYQYVVTLSPGAGDKYKDGNGKTAKELIASANFRNRLKEAEGMLNGTVPVPRDDGALHKGYAANAAHVKRMGSELVNPNTCDINSPIGTDATAAATTNTPGQKTLEDLLPMQIAFSIPEYPRFTGLKPGDVLVLPESATYRDWVVTAVTREFNQGINKLTIQANRAIAAKPFVQKEVLDKAIGDYNNYYWLM
jgi:hypothetical protein